ILTRYTEAGEPLHLRCHLLDVTQRVLTERELRRRTLELSQANEGLTKANQELELHKQTLRDLYNEAPVMYFSLGPQGRVAVCNKTMLRQLGYQREELFGQPYTRFLPPDSRQQFLQNPAIYQRAGEVET